MANNKGKNNKGVAKKVVASTSKKKKKADTGLPFRAPRGMKDILPQEQKYWEYVIETAKTVARGWDYHRIDTPLVEETALFTRAMGEDTDIVSKELFELKSRGRGGQYSLRPEGTAPVVRAFIENGLRSRPKPVKLFYTGAFFRYDRPQKGRYRQHHQFGFEVFGSNSPATEAELMYIEHVFLQQLGLEHYKFHVNSLGEPGDRKAYIKLLKDHYRRNRSKMCQNCKQRLTSNPLRVLDCKQEKCQQLANTAPSIIDHLSDDAKKHFEAVTKLLDGLEVPYEVVPSLVRGLDYYTHTVWEIVPQVVAGDEGSDAGQQGSLGGGGRYNGLVKELGGRRISSVGASHGIERIIEQVKAESIELTLTDEPQVFVAQLGESAKLIALRTMRDLQQAQIRFAASVDRDGMQPQLKLAERLKVKWIVVIGQKEVLDKTVILRNLESGMQEVVSQDTLIAELNKRLNIVAA
jgi:histidyl-tRNA synthetase